MSNQPVEIQDADYEDIWGTIEEAAAVLDGEVITATESKAEETEASADLVDAAMITFTNGSSIAVAEVSEEPARQATLALVEMKDDPGPAPEELPKSPIGEAAGAHVYKRGKDDTGSYLVYSMEHDFKLYTFHSDGICYVDHEDGKQETFNYLDENDARLPVDQAIIFGANLRLGINNGFQIDTFQKLDWYHSKRVTLDLEIDAVEAALKDHLTMLKNDLKRLNRLEDQASDFAQGLLKGKSKSVKMTHGTISFTDRKTTAVLDNSEDAPVIRDKHLKALFKDKGSREKYGMSVQITATYGKDSALIAKEELANYENYLKKIEAIEPDENGEVEIPEYQPLHPGWMIKPASRSVYFKGPKTK